MDDKTVRSVYSVTSGILRQLEQTLGSPNARAMLANLRNSIGRDSGNPEMWAIMFQNLPDEFLGETSKQTFEERAIVSVLQLYALHQQGQSETVNTSSKDDEWSNIGRSLSVLRIGDDSKAIDNRFNAMVTSSTFEELVHHLRQLIKILKSKTKSSMIARVNYSRLAQDLFWFQMGNQESLRIRWAKSYYRRYQGEENNEK